MSMTVLLNLNQVPDGWTPTGYWRYIKKFCSYSLEWRIWKVYFYVRVIKVIRNFHSLTQSFNRPMICANRLSESIFISSDIEQLPSPSPPSLGVFKHPQLKLQLKVQLNPNSTLRPQNPNFWKRKFVEVEVEVEASSQAFEINFMRSILICSNLRPQLCVTTHTYSLYYINFKGVQELQKLHRVGKFFNRWQPDPPPPYPPKKRKY